MVRRFILKPGHQVIAVVMANEPEYASEDSTIIELVHWVLPAGELLLALFCDLTHYLLLPLKIKIRLGRSSRSKKLYFLGPQDAAGVCSRWITRHSRRSK